MKIKFSDFDNFGDVFEFNEFFDEEYGPPGTDNDGIGYFATDKKKSNLRISISEILSGKQIVPSWATHIAWYNK